ncbi:MAG: hypothetical protein ACK5LC_08405, partial [Coprobacillaceae bacterium]
NAEYIRSLVISMYEQNGEELLFVEVCNLNNQAISSRIFSIHKIKITSVLDYITSQVNLFSNIEVIVLGVPGVEINGKLKSIDYKVFQPTNFQNML